MPLSWKPGQKPGWLPCGRRPGAGAAAERGGRLRARHPARRAGQGRGRGLAPGARLGGRLRARRPAGTAGGARPAPPSLGVRRRCDAAAWDVGGRARRARGCGGAPRRLRWWEEALPCRSTLTGARVTSRRAVRPLRASAPDGAHLRVHRLSARAQRRRRRACAARRRPRCCRPRPRCRRRPTRRMRRSWRASSAWRRCCARSPRARPRTLGGRRGRPPPLRCPALACCLRRRALTRGLLFALFYARCSGPAVWGALSLRGCAAVRSRRAPVAVTSHSLAAATPRRPPLGSGCGPAAG